MSTDSRLTAPAKPTRRRQTLQLQAWVRGRLAFLILAECCDYCLFAVLVW